jgi:phosphomannomutase
MVGLQYSPSPNVPLGVEHLQMLGVKYYMALNTSLQEQAAKDPYLKLIATLGPYSVSYSGSSTGPQGTQQQYWKFYLVLGSPRAHPLANQPVVMRGINNTSQPRWLQVMEPWYLDPSAWDVYIAAAGPSNWKRVPYGATNLPATPEPPTQVSGVLERNASISFDVSRTGVPVVVTVSYFPNWQAHGAKGPYRVSPNLMVVVPTSHHVVLYYGTTPVDYEGWGLTLLGLLGLAWLIRSPRAKVAAVRWVGPGGRQGPFGGRNGGWAGASEGPSRPARPAEADGNGSGGEGGGEEGWVEASVGRVPAGVEAGEPAALPPASGPNVEGAGPPAPLLASLPEGGAMDKLDEVFKAYDIRGVVPDQLDAELARKVGAAFAAFAKAPRVLVGHDMRASGPELVEAFTEGAISAGVDVVQLGLISTDEMFYASGALGSPGAMFTASHNPARYNGIKLCLAGARPVGIESGLAEIRAWVEQGYPKPVPPERRGKVSHQDVLADYAAKVRSFVDLAALKPLKVIADTANGMGGLVVPRVFEGLPFELEVLYPELDGNFPNHPADPIQPSNLRDLQARILETGADVGLAFDGDADRCFLVDDKAVPVSGSTTTAIVAKAMLERYPGSKILYNLICSKAVPEVIRENGGEPIMTRVGHSFIKQIMAGTGAVFGGEHSGHYYFRDNYRADSGSIAALVVLEVLSKAGVPLSELRKPFERYAMSGEINTEVKDPAGTVETVASHYAKEHPEAKQSRMDGVTVDFGDWWFNVRPSNTEPLVRLNVEAADEPSCKQHTEEVLSLIREHG